MRLEGAPYYQLFVCTIRPEFHPIRMIFRGLGSDFPLRCALCRSVLLLYECTEGSGGAGIGKSGFFGEASELRPWIKEREEAGLVLPGILFGLLLVFRFCFASCFGLG